jgi:hypothetical protein
MLLFVVFCSTLSPCLAANTHPLGLPQKSRKSSGINTYKTKGFKSLWNEHLQKTGEGVGIMVNCTSDEGRASRATIGSGGTDFITSFFTPCYTEASAVRRAP